MTAAQRSYVRFLAAGVFGFQLAYMAAWYLGAPLLLVFLAAFLLAYRLPDYGLTRWGR